MVLSFRDLQHIRPTIAEFAGEPVAYQHDRLGEFRGVLTGRQIEVGERMCFEVALEPNGVKTWLPGSALYLTARTEEVNQYASV